ncbi:hypothetical protein [Pantoea sp. GL120224-02]|uniref:hypothetical protein n=1 Tax=Pantoea sp. GL120224-02 TaxID=1378084 RepID=UPI000BC7A992|nr:hypothetical protein [Pantoea sp. GL120224-02]SNY70986.1 hypothetical protein SAMN02744778_03116 [Pantoea sp. GL120224-02]
MDIQEYFSRIKSESQLVFENSIIQKQKLGKLHHLSSCIHDFSSLIHDKHEKKILETVSAQLESSNFSLAIGLYRQAFSSLRLALEMGLGAIYFSTSKLEMHEWLDGRMDIKWSILIDEENGVLSKRFVKTFFLEMLDIAEGFRTRAKSAYRKLSEYVHGNNETWSEGSIKIKYNEEVFLKYCELYEIVTETILFTSMCRYAKDFDDSERESIQFLNEEFSHIQQIRDYFGRS